jgi:hypothetical protein
VNLNWPVEFTVLKSRGWPWQEVFCALTDAVVMSPTCNIEKSSNFGLSDVHILT